MPADPSASTPVILIVDDEPDVLASLKALVAAEFPQVRVRTAASAAEAFLVLDAEHLDLVISDYRMRGMNGVELLRAMRKRVDGLACLLVTGHADLGLVVEAVEEARVDAVVPKPPDPERLSRSIRTALARPRIPTTALMGPIAGFQAYS